MQIGVYGSGYLGTVVSACLADFGSPVSCCHEDSSRMVEMSQGKVPFHEKNLADMIRRNVRSGRLSYSTDIEAFARKSQIIFLAEDSNQHLASHRYDHIFGGDDEIGPDQRVTEQIAIVFQANKLGRCVAVDRVVRERIAERID